MFERAEERAERVLAVGIADRSKAAELERARALDGAVVREHPVAAPQLAHERMRVREPDAAARLAAHVRDREQRLDRMLADELRERRVGRRRRLEEQAREPAV